MTTSTTPTPAYTWQATLPETFYITTAIDYVNAAPHLGHAYEKMATDTVARLYKLLGVPTFFLTGTDEHGIKVEKNARAHGMEPKAFTDKLSQEFVKAWQHCSVDYHRFIRTTDEDHRAVVHHLWRVLQAKGDIYKASYKARYCSGCEAFLTERDLTPQGDCQTHQVAPEWVEEENYFFRLSAYKEVLKSYLEAHPEFVQPAFRKQEVLNMLEDVQDISVSRSRSSVSWGIPVPEDDSQVIYVWIDALSNYLTGIAYAEHLEGSPTDFLRYWQTSQGAPNAVHIIGKDILRFHAIYWPAMLLGAGLTLPKTVLAHGFITLNDAKISKSIGNVISPFDITGHFRLPNTDSVRYYLLTQTPFGSDGNFSMDDFKLKVNADLANNLGNLLNRTLSMVKKYHAGRVPTYHREAPVVGILSEVETLASGVVEAYRQYDFSLVAELLLKRVDQGNRLINDQEPWTLFKEERHTELANLLGNVLESLRIVAVLFQPLLPNLSQAIFTQLGLQAVESDACGRSDADLVTQLACHLPADLLLQPTGPLLPRLDSELAGAEAKRSH
jgi:methionyl-tRNA synthetase